MQTTENEDDLYPIPRNKTVQNLAVWALKRCLSAQLPLSSELLEAKCAICFYLPIF
jgi:hypothetical protein